MSAAYDALPLDERGWLNRLETEHRCDHTQKILAKRNPEDPLAKRHSPSRADPPRDRTESTFLGIQLVKQVVGLEPIESTALLKQLHPPIRSIVSYL